MPQHVVGDGRGWRELALRIDQAGFEYAVSETVAALESPCDVLATIPRIYVSDPAMVASVLRLQESAPGQGVPLVSAGWPELDDVVVGHAIRFTTLGQAIMDGLTGEETEQRRAERTLLRLIPEQHRERLVGEDEGGPHQHPDRDQRGQQGGGGESGEDGAAGEAAA